jgi:hypothetical protein
MAAITFHKLIDMLSSVLSEVISSQGITRRQVDQVSCLAP